MEVDQREGLRQDLRQGPDVATVAAEEVCTVDCTAAGSQMVVAEMANTVAGTVVGPVAQILAVVVVATYGQPVAALKKAALQRIPLLHEQAAHQNSIIIRAKKNGCLHKM